jgi:hypothetical protein
MLFLVGINICRLFSFIGGQIFSNYQELEYASPYYFDFDFPQLILQKLE